MELMIVALLEQMMKSRKLGKNVIWFVKLANFNVFMEEIEIPYPWNVFQSINGVISVTSLLELKLAELNM